MMYKPCEQEEYAQSGIRENHPWLKDDSADEVRKVAWEGAV